MFAVKPATIQECLGRADRLDAGGRMNDGDRVLAGMALTVPTIKADKASGGMPGLAATMYRLIAMGAISVTVDHGSEEFTITIAEELRAGK